MASWSDLALCTWCRVHWTKKVFPLTHWAPALHPLAVNTASWKFSTPNHQAKLFWTSFNCLLPHNWQYRSPFTISAVNQSTQKILFRGWVTHLRPNLQFSYVAKMQNSSVCWTDTKAHEGYTASYFGGNKDFLRVHILDRSTVWVLDLSPDHLSLAGDEERQAGIAILKLSSTFSNYFNYSYSTLEPNTQLCCCSSQPETGRVLIAKVKCEPKLIKPCDTLKIITREIWDQTPFPFKGR